jgi:diguanylate cyclase
MKNNKNLWFLFTLIFLISLIIISILIVNKQKEIRKSVEDEHRHYTEIMINTTNTILLQYESMLTLLGSQLMEGAAFKDYKKSQAVLNRTLAINPSLLGFGLLSPEGTYLAVSRNLNPTKMPMMLTDAVIEESFKKALSSNEMVLGRTYFLKPLNSWVIPLRKSLRNSKGEVVAVMTTGIKLHTKYGFLEDLALKTSKTLFIIKDLDDSNVSYRQYYSKAEEKNYKKVYYSAIEREKFNLLDKILLEQSTSLNSLRDTAMITTTFLKDFDDNELFIGLGYSDRYRLWTVVASSAYDVKGKYSSSLVTYLLFYIVLIIFLFIMFQYIIKAEASKNEDLRFQASHDILTKLANRNYMYENINKWKGDKDRKYYLLYLDLDNFKNINDNHGHQIGDAILIEVSKRLKSFLNQGEMIVRQGGDEFIILSYETPHSGDCFQGLIPMLCDPYHIDNMEFRIGASIGVAHSPNDAKHLEQLLSLADIAMYEAKKSKNECVFFSKEMHSTQHKKVAIEHELRGALDRGEISMAYQPQINRDGTLHGVEALVRWNSENLVSCHLINLYLLLKIVV